MSNEFFDSDEEVVNADELNNYKGLYGEENQEEEERYFEGGAHFPYRWLCDRLEGINRQNRERGNMTILTSESSTKSNKPAVAINVEDFSYSKNIKKNVSTKDTNKAPSLSILNSGNSLSNIMENNFLSFLNENINQNNKSRNVNMVDNVYKNETAYEKIKPEAKINILHNGIITMNENKVISSPAKKQIMSTFKKENKKPNDNMHIFTSYTNELMKKGNIFKDKHREKNPVLINHEFFESQTKKAYENIMNTVNKKINSASEEKAKILNSKALKPINNNFTKIQANKSKNTMIVPSCNSKLTNGRNVDAKQKLNPHNTCAVNNIANRIQSKTNSLNRGESVSINYKKEIKKLNLENLLKSDCITSSLDNREFHNLPIRSNSPGKILSETSRYVREKEKSKSFFENSAEKIKQEKINGVNNTGLNDIISKIGIPTENKSRNAQRSNIAGTTSNVFTDKAQSMQNASYQKTNLMSKNTQTVTKPNNTIIQQNIVKKKNKIIVNKSFSANNKFKTLFNQNQTKINCNMNTTSKKVNNITINNLSSVKPSSVVREQLKFNEKQQENILIGTPAAKKESNVTKSKVELILVLKPSDKNPKNYIKIDYTKFRFKTHLECTNGAVTKSKTINTTAKKTLPPKTTSKIGTNSYSLMGMITKKYKDSVKS